VILAVCSKNDDTTARLPFANLPDMVLTEDDIAVFVANWEPKPENLRRIARGEGPLNAVEPARGY
jgi:predicted enzyme involved in methoxymalonyl-ACP biosynthesis